MLTDSEERELQEAVEQGRRAQIVREFMKEFLLEARTQTISRLEQDSFNDSDELLAPIVYLRTLRLFELDVEKYISLGEIAEGRLNEDGE